MKFIKGDRSEDGGSNMDADTHRKKQAQPSIISDDIEIVGNLNCTGEIHLEGKLKGNVDAAKLTIGKSGHVLGDIYVDSLRVSGSVEGKVTATKVEISGTAYVKGNIYHETISIESGAELNGNFQRSDQQEKSLQNEKTGNPNRDLPRHPKKIHPVN